MSYLDAPRLHFAGLFYTGPSTINNITQNYIPTTPLTLPGQPTMLDPNAVLWNPNGVAQWWLEQCSVLSAVGPTGTAITSSSADPVIGASVQSPSPTTPMSDGASGFYDIAKMVDLDPDQQGRSALYGVRISVKLANGAGFQGLLTVAELRQLNPRISGAGGSWGAVGNWMGTLQNVVWSGDFSSSPLLTALKVAATDGLAVKLTVDLHQNNPGNIFTSGDMFCYGRVLGSIGPALAGELSQVVPGRCIQWYKAAPPPSAIAAKAAPASQPVRRVSARDAVVAQTAAEDTAESGDVLAKAAPKPPKPWNPAFCVIDSKKSTLSVDIGASIRLATTGSGPSLSADGTFLVNDGIEVGVMDPATKKFTPFANGALTFNGQYQQLTSASKNCQLVSNSGVFTFALTSTDLANAKQTPLAITVNGTIVAAEFSNGYWMDIATASQRLQCGGGTGQTQVMVRQWGKPIVGKTPPITVTVQQFEWIEQDGQWGNPQSLPVSTDLSFTFRKTDANGNASVTTTINVPDITLPAIRQPLDSYMYYITMTDPDGNPIGDGPMQKPPVLPPGSGPPYEISVVLWNPYQAPANPTWANDVGPIFAAYARLYPGMQARLDISDEQTVKGFAPVVLARMSTSVLDPAYMPVTRDLSPTKMQMVVSYLKGIS